MRFYELHVWPKDGADRSLLVPDASDDEINALIGELETFADEVLRYLVDEVVPNIDTRPRRSGVVTEVTLIRGNNPSSVTDFLLFVDGVLSGSGGIVEALGEKFSVRATSRDDWRAAGSWPVADDRSSHARGN